MKTIFELLREETSGNIRTRLLSKINDVINNLFSFGQKTCTLSLITNVFSPIALPLGAMLNVHAMQILEQALIRFRKDVARTYTLYSQHSAMTYISRSSS